MLGAQLPALRARIGVERFGRRGRTARDGDALGRLAWTLRASRAKRDDILRVGAIDEAPYGEEVAGLERPEYGETPVDVRPVAQCRTAAADAFADSVRAFEGGSENFGEDHAVGSHCIRTIACRCKQHADSVPSRTTRGYGL